MKVEELERFGKAPEIPVKALKQQEKIIFRLLRKDVGLFDFLAIKLNIKKQSHKISIQFPVQIKQIKKVGQGIDKQVIMMAALFFALANSRGRKLAKEFMVRLMQKVAPITISAIYQLNKLVKCEGDEFDNHKKFNRALFAEVDQIGAWKNIISKETDDLLEIKILSCLIIEFFYTVGCSEVAELACALFLTGYPLIEEATQSKFYRSCTLSKGGNCCLFHFYRKGTAPVKEP